MKIETIEEYEAIPNGRMLKLFYSGNKWDNLYGTCVNVIKIGERLYTIDGFSYFNEKNEGDGYEFELAYNENDRFNKILKNENPIKNIRNITF